MPTPKTTTIEQVVVELCGDNQWHFDAFGVSDTQPVFSGAAATLREALKACLGEVENDTP